MNTFESQPGVPENKAQSAADGPGAERGAAAPASGLPCQYYDKCIEKEKYQPPSRASLTPNQKTLRHKMILGVEWMVRKHGLERVGVLTLTFGVPGSGKGSYATWALRQQAKHWDFVQARWHSFCTNVVARRYEDWICVFELHKDRVWHIHVVVSTREDIRTGTNIEVLSNYDLPFRIRRRRCYRNEGLAQEWQELRHVCCRYRFGRVELLPVKKTGLAVGHYLGNYLIKTYLAIPPGRRCRLIRFSRQINQSISAKFSIHSLGQLIYRTRLKIAARMLDFQQYEDFAEYFGHRWNFLLRNAIAWIPIPFRFPRGAFEHGFATVVLADYARRPEAYLDERGKEKMADVSRELWRRLREALEDNLEARLKCMAYQVGDNLGDSSATIEDRQNELFFDPNIPF